VLDRIVAETHGNPLALLELPRGLSPAQVAAGFGLPVSVPLAGRIEESFRRRLAGLPSQSRRLLLVAAADPTGDAVLVWRAAELLGIADSAAEAAEAEGLVDLTAGVVFRHPLVRSAAYGAASARIGARRTRPWPRRPIPAWTRIAGLGTALRRRHAPTRTWRPTLSSRLGERRPGAGSRRRPCLCNDRPSCQSTRPGGRVGRSPQPRPTARPVIASSAASRVFPGDSRSRVHLARRPRDPRRDASISGPSGLMDRLAAARGAG